MNPNSPPAFLTSRQVFAITTLSKASVYKFARAGNFPLPIKLGKKSVWDSREIEAWMQREIERPRTAGRPAK